MKHATAALCLLLVGAAVHADPITWTFDANASTHAVPGDGGNLGAVNFATLSGSFSGNQTTSIAEVIASTSPIPGQDADTFSGQIFNAVVDLKDALSGDPGQFSFIGHLSGSVSASSASLTAPFDNPMTVHHTLGGHDYAVTIGPFVSPTSPSVNGELDMTVTIDGEVLAPPPTRDAPEPASAILGAMGVGAGYLLWKRRRIATE